MKRTGFVRRIAATLAFAGFISGQSLQAASPILAPSNTTQQAAQVRVVARDVRLGEDGAFRGQVVNSLGTAQAKSKVVVMKQGQVVAMSQTDASGNFEFAGLTGGVYDVYTEQSGNQFRLWTNRSAPPAASQTALIVNSDAAVLGQNTDRPILNFLSNPWVLGGLVAAGIAIPLALDHNSGS